MNYKVLILSNAERQLSSLPKGDFLRIDPRILALGENPRPAGCKKLRGREGWRIRIGKYRVVYEINDSQQLVLVRDVGHRKDVYR